MKKIILSLILSLLFFSFANAQTSDGAFNNVFVKDLNAGYNPADQTINGQAIIANFADQTFDNLSYKLELLYDIDGEEAGLGKDVDVFYPKDTFSVNSQGEVIKTFNYQIPSELPNGKYNFIFQAIDSQGRSLGYDSFPFELTKENQDLIEVDLKEIFIELNGEDHSWNEGPTVQPKEKVNLKFKVKNLTQKTIDNIIPNLEVFPYTEQSKSVLQKKLTAFSLNPGEEKQLSYEMPDLTKAESYLAIVKLQKDSQTLTSPIKGRWVVEGSLGRILSSGFKDNQLIMEVVGSPFNDGKEVFLTTSLEDVNNQKCFSQKKKIDFLGTETQTLVLPVSLEKACTNPTLNSVLTIGGETVDTYQQKLGIQSAQLLNASFQKIDNNKKPSINKNIIGIIILAIGLIVLLLALIIKLRKGKDYTKIGMFLILIIGLGIFLGRETKAWTADAGKYMDYKGVCWTGGRYTDPYQIPCSGWEGYTSSRQKSCLQNKENDCFLGGCFMGGGREEWGFNKVYWSQPYPNQVFSIQDNVPVSIEDVLAWCYNSDSYSSNVAWEVYSRDNPSFSPVKAGSEGVSIPCDSLTDWDEYWECKYSIATGSVAGSKKDWSLGTFPVGHYAIYLNIYGSWCNPLYHGMIRYFEVRDMVTVSGKVTDKNGNLLSNIPIEICGEDEIVKTNSNGEYSINIDREKGYCVRIKEEQLPAEYKNFASITATNNNPHSCAEITNTSSYEYQKAGTDVWANCPTGDPSSHSYETYDRSSDSGVDFIIELSNQTVDLKVKEKDSGTAYTDADISTPLNIARNNQADFYWTSENVDSCKFIEGSFDTPNPFEVTLNPNQGSIYTGRFSSSLKDQTTFTLECCDTSNNICAQDSVAVQPADATLYGTLTATTPISARSSSTLIAKRTGGTAEGDINYKFYCNESDYNPSDPLANTRCNVTKDPDSDPNYSKATCSCTYDTKGRKTAKVLIVQEDVKTEPTVEIIVSQCEPDYMCDMPTGSLTCTPDKCGQVITENLIGDCKEITCNPRGIVDRKIYCVGEEPPKCETTLEKTCPPCGSSNWTEN